MAIKKLQNDHTTPEQSKRLLELGVPADSANCVWYNPYYDGDRPELAEIYIWKGKYPQRVDKYTLPCWSVGRLMEIYVIARGLDTAYLPIERGEDMVKYLIRLYEEKAKDLDFSKLEE